MGEMKLRNYITDEPVMQFWSNAKPPFHNWNKI